MSENNQFDVTPLDNSFNISNITKYDKFVEFHKYRDDIYNFNHSGLIKFHTNNMSCEKITLEEKIESINNMIECLEKKIDQDVENKLILIRRKFKQEHNQKDNLERLINAKRKLLGYDLKPEI